MTRRLIARRSPPALRPPHPRTARPGHARQRAGGRPPQSRGGCGRVSGVQPQEDGRLECLECGGWYRLLPPHLGAAHRMSAAEYREAHQLPRRLGLRARDLSEQAREQGRARYAARKDIRAAMAQGRAGGPGPDAVRSSQETAHRPGVIEARRRGGQGRRAGPAAHHRRRLEAPTGGRRQHRAGRRRRTPDRRTASGTGSKQLRDVSAR
ncbi:MucR family transcriptional regulator [Streptomyces polychromogenes]